MKVGAGRTSSMTMRAVGSGVGSVGGATGGFGTVGFGVGSGSLPGSSLLARAVTVPEMLETFAALLSVVSIVVVTSMGRKRGKVAQAITVDPISSAPRLRALDGKSPPV